MAFVTHTALDGSEAAIESRGLDLSSTASSVVALELGGGKRPGFTGGGRSLGESLAQVSRVDLTEQYSHQGGTLRIGIGPGRTGGTLVAVWEKGRSSITTVLYSSISAGDAIGLFDRFVLSETSSGEATLIPKRPGETPFVDAPVIVKEISNLGLLEIAKLTPAKARALPKWRGTKVAGGELFVSDGGTPRMRFVLVSRNAVATVMPKHSVFDEVRALSELSEVQVSWTR